MPVAPDDPRLKKVAYARIRGEGIDVHVRKLEVMIGRNSKNSTLDVILGDNMNISRQHAKITYNPETKNFELVVMGKNGAHVNGTLYTAASKPQPLRSRDLLAIADKQFYFLLPCDPRKIRNYAPLPKPGQADPAAPARPASTAAGQPAQGPALGSKPTQVSHLGQQQPPQHTQPAQEQPPPQKAQQPTMAQSQELPTQAQPVHGTVAASLAAMPQTATHAAALPTTAPAVPRLSSQMSQVAQPAAMLQNAPQQQQAVPLHLQAQLQAAQLMQQQHLQPQQPQMQPGLQRGALAHLSANPVLASALTGSLAGSMAAQQPHAVHQLLQQQLPGVAAVGAPSAAQLQEAALATTMPHAQPPPQ